MRKLKGMDAECVPGRWKEEWNCKQTGEQGRYSRCEDGESDKK